MSKKLSEQNVGSNHRSHPVLRAEGRNQFRPLPFPHDDVTASATATGGWPLNQTEFTSYARWLWTRNNGLPYSKKETLLAVNSIVMSERKGADEVKVADKEEEVYEEEDVAKMLGGAKRP